MTSLTQAPEAPTSTARTGRSVRAGRLARLTPYGLVGPAVIAFAAVLGYPLVRLVWLSVQDFGPRSLFTGEAPFVGLGNFTRVLGDGDFWAVLLRTLVVSVACVVSLMVLGFLLASLLRLVSNWARVMLSVCLVLVWAMPMVSASMIWRWLFEPQYGVLNWVITQLGVFGDFSAHDWFSSPGQALFLIIALIVWKGLPFVALTLYAAMGQIPDDLYEAAGLDGAGRWSTARHVTLPILGPVLAVLVLLEVIWSVNSFTPFWVLTQGGPDGGTTTLGVYSYLEAFTRNDYGGGAAIAIVTVVLLAVLAVLYVRRLFAQGEVTA
ncbi:carbohydrate ABC transporter permease [Kribbella sp. CA-253562]|uniref:carbohydrate ABC transporter permease n=1 Tax=Kribbella sp. CA-253562 TaxID=3239942 RepID=UPI003D8FA95C